MSKEMVTELGVRVNVAPDHLTPERTTTFYNPKMSINRMLVLCALKAAVKERKQDSAQKKTHCLDGFGATGIMGLQWKFHLGDDVSVTVTDTNPASVSNIRRNCALNGVGVEEDAGPSQAGWSSTEERGVLGKDLMEKCGIGRQDGSWEAYPCRMQPGEVRTKRDGEGDADENKTSLDNYAVTRETENRAKKGEHCGGPEESNDEGMSNEKLEPQQGNVSLPETGAIKIICCDVHLVMRQHFFDFIHLDPYGCATPFLDSAFSNASNHGIVSITSTDTAALYGKCPQVTLRNYGGQVTRCEYLKELAARLIVGSAARAAARCGKGVVVLLTVAVEHFVLVILRVHRGAGSADRSVQRVKHVVHCQVCGQRCFVPNTLNVPKTLYSLLTCPCHDGAPGGTAQLLGPVWSGDIYDADFVCQMEMAGRELRLGKKKEKLLETLRTEAQCLGKTSQGESAGAGDTSSAAPVVPGETRGCRDGGGVGDMRDGVTSGQAKRRRTEKDASSPSHPAFYFNLRHHGIKNMDRPRITQVIQCLRDRGFRASRTHFDPEGVRTNAGLPDFQAVLSDASNPTMKSN